jgi:hypothetical protein
MSLSGGVRPLLALVAMLSARSGARREELADG